MATAAITLFIILSFRKRAATDEVVARFAFLRILTIHSAVRRPET
jgi:hypothetical protein